MTLVSGSVTCGSDANGGASIAVAAPVAPQPIGTPFQTMINLIQFTPGTSSTWAGYDLELAYDTSVLQATGDVRGLCSAAG